MSQFSVHILNSHQTLGNQFLLISHIFVIGETCLKYASRKHSGIGKVNGHTMTLHVYTLNECPYCVSTPYTICFLKYSQDKLLKVKVTTARSQLKSSLHQDIADANPKPMSLSTSQILWLPRCNIGLVFKVKGTKGRSTVKLRA